MRLRLAWELKGLMDEGVGEIETCLAAHGIDGGRGR